MSKEIEFDSITTRGGDKGETTTFSGERVRKDSLQMELLGDIDELISYLGLAKNFTYRKTSSIIKTIQEKLMTISALVATSPKSNRYDELTQITEKDLLFLEKKGKYFYNKVILPQEFILPGNRTEGAHLDYARSLARRCERRIISVIREAPARPDLHLCQNYLNRLSDALFIFARYEEGY